MPYPNDVFKRQADEVRSIFGDMEIVEAKADFIVYVTADEQQQSQRGDPNNCMFSNACKRAFGSKGVLFYPTVAYVDMIDPNNSSRRIVMRFTLPVKTRQRLEAFDRGEGNLNEATFVLKAVSKGSTLDYRRKSQRKYDKQRQAGKPVSPEKQEQAARGHRTRRTNTLMGVRSGHGQIHTRNAEA